MEPVFEVSQAFLTHQLRAVSGILVGLDLDNRNAAVRYRQLKIGERQWRDG